MRTLPTDPQPVIIHQRATVAETIRAYELLTSGGTLSAETMAAVEQLNGLEVDLAMFLVRHVDDPDQRRLAIHLGLREALHDRDPNARKGVCLVDAVLGVVSDEEVAHAALAAFCGAEEGHAFLVGTFVSGITVHAEEPDRVIPETLALCHELVHAHGLEAARDFARGCYRCR